MREELDRYLDLLFDLNNPVYFSFLIILIIAFITYIFYIHIYVPNKKKYLEEKLELELNNSRLMALFSEVSPDPLIRLNMEGEVIYFNQTAKNIFSDLDHQMKISQIIPQINLAFSEAISNNSSIKFELQINNVYYSILFKGVKALSLAHLYFTDLSERKEYENKLLESEKRFKTLSLHLQEQIEKEKQRIGRELHDSIGQNLLLLKMKVDDKSDRSSEVFNIIDSTVKDLNEIIFDLKPRILEDFGLTAAVKNLSDTVNRCSRIRGTVNVMGENKTLEKDTELYLYRIIQESLNNIIKHSQANEYYIQFIYNPDSLKIITYDDGKGIDFDVVKNGNGNGLFNINERIKHLGGKMKINSSMNEGTMITMDIPYE